MLRAQIFGAALLSILVVDHAQPATARVTIPLVGCAADGQLGPMKPPHDGSKLIAIPASPAQRLAWYQAPDDIGVLAPRGWHCFETYGSNGANLYVSPQRVKGSDLFSSKWKGFAGPAIQFSVSYGDTSGRFEVAKVIARVFPAHMNFVRDVITEKIEPASSFPRGPYPTDKLTYRNNEMVEFETPAKSEGLGTDSRLRKNKSPIRGVAILFRKNTSLLQLSIRLPENERDLNLPIVSQTEHESVHFGN